MSELISKTIRMRRKELGLTRPDLAGHAQVSVNTIYKIESGEGNPTIEILEKIADILGMQIEMKIKELNRP